MKVTIHASAPASDMDSEAALHSIWFMYLRWAERSGGNVTERVMFGSSSYLGLDIDEVRDVDFLRGEVGVHRVVRVSLDPGSAQSRITTLVTVLVYVDGAQLAPIPESAGLSHIRSYIFQPYQMVIDHRTGRETGELCAVLDGRLEELLVDGEPA